MGMFDDLVPEDKPKAAGGMFADLVPERLPGVTRIPTVKVGPPADLGALVDNPPPDINGGESIAAPIELGTPASLIDRSWMQVAEDTAGGIRQTLNSVVGGLAGAPVNIANLTTQIPRQGIAIADRLGLGERVPEMARSMVAPIQQPDAVKGIRESLNRDNAAEQAMLSPKAQAQAAEFQDADGLLGSLGYLVKNPSFAGTQAAAQLPQFLQMIPGSALGTLATQAVGAGAQNAQQVEEYLLDNGATPDEAAATATTVFGASAALNAAAPALTPGGLAIERMIGGKVGSTLGKNAASRAAIPFLGETASEGAVEGLDQVIQNVATGQPLGEGVGQSMALGAAIGAGPGALAGINDAFAGPRVAPPPSPPILPPLVPDALLGNDIAPTPVAPEDSGDIETLIKNLLGDDVGAELDLPPLASPETAAPSVDEGEAVATTLDTDRIKQALGDILAPESSQAPAIDPAAVAGLLDDPAVLAALNVGLDAAPAPIAAPAIESAPEKIKPDPEVVALRNEVGWETRGGQILRDGEIEDTNNIQFPRKNGDVVGRTSWSGKTGPDGRESMFWRERPVKLTENEANTAFDRLERGEKLTKRQERFIEYARETAQGYRADSNAASAETRDLMDRAGSEVAREYEAGNITFDDLRVAADFDNEARGQAIDELRDTHGIEVAQQDQAEALSLVQLAQEADAAGLDPFDVAQASNESNNDYAARIWSAIKEKRNAPDSATTQGNRGDSTPVQPQRNADSAEGFALGSRPEPAAQEVAPTPAAGLFGNPSPREVMDSARRARDSRRDGREGTGRTDMASGDGELFAGRRPEQSDVEDDSSVDAVEALENETGKLSREGGKADAVRNRLAEAVDKVVGPDRVEYLRGVDGLPKRLRDGVKKRVEQREGKGRTAALYDPVEKKVYLFTDVVTTPERAAFNAAHEIAGHHGLRELLGDKLAPALEIALQNPTVRSVAEAIADQRKIKFGTQSGRLLAAEESLAELAAAVRTGNFSEIESRYKVAVPEGVRAKLTRAVDNFLRRLQEMLDDLFGSKTFSDEDVRALLEAAWQAVNDAPTLATDGNGALAGDIAEQVSTAPDQTDTPAFKRWSNGLPIVTPLRAMKYDFQTGKPVLIEGYHGSPDARFARDDGVFRGGRERFGMASDGSDRAFWFASDRGMARSYADDTRAFDYQNSEPGVLHNYVRMDNPLVVDGGGKVWHEVQRRGKTSDVIDEARAGGHDSVIIRNVRDNYNNGPSTKPAVTYVVFDSRQIKSATNNRGTFDPENPSILEAVDPPTSDEILQSATGASVIRDGRLLTVIDAVKAAGGDLAGIRASVLAKDIAGLADAIDAVLPSIRPKPVPTTGTKNAVTDAERSAAGRDPIVRDAVKTNEETLAEAMRAMKQNPYAGEEAVAKLASGGAAAVSLADEAILLVYKTELLNKRDNAAKTLSSEAASESAKEVARRTWSESEAKVSALDMAAVNSGREWGRLGQFRQRMLRNDFTLAAMERKERARLERPLTQAESAKIKEMADVIASQQARLEKLQARVKNAESEGAYEDLVKSMSRPKKNRPTLEYLRNAANDARARLSAMPDVPRKRGQSGAVMSPAALADLSVIGAYHVANGAAKLSDFVAAMRADLGEMFDAFKTDHPRIFAASKLTANKPIKADATPAEVMSGIDKANVAPNDVKKLVAAVIGDGVRGEDAVIDAVSGLLGMDAARVREMFIATSPRAAPTRSEAKEELADLRKLVRLQKEIERLEAGEAKAPRPPSAPDSPALASRKAELAEVRKRLKPVRDEEGRYQQMRGKRIENRIKDLEARIANGDFSPRRRVPRALSEANQLAQYELDKAKESFLRHQFIDNLNNRSPLAKVFGTVGEVFNLSRAIMTSLDLSAVLRQGGFISFGHPVMAMKALGPSLRSFVSDKADHKIRTDIESRKNAPLYSKYGLQLTGIGAGPLTQIEEAYASRWLDNLPTIIGGGLVRGSGRAYTAFLNKLRADSFDSLAASLGRKSELTEAEGKAIANFINVSTGRGKVGVSENAGEALNTVFFAPRLVASRFQLLAGQPMYGGTPRSKKLIAMEYARFLMGVSVVYALAAFGLDEDDSDKPLIQTDPRSSAFGKVRIGNTYLDPLTGLAQVSVLLARLASGESVGSGDPKPLRQGNTLTDLRRALGEDIPAHELGKDGKLPFGSSSAASVIGRFLRSKMAPVPGAIVSVLSGTNVIGEEASPAQVGRELVTPMSFQDIGALMEEHGVAKGTAITMLGLLGMGMQHHTQTNEQQFADFNENVDLVKTDVKERLVALPVEEWPDAMKAMKSEYGEVLEGIDLDYYKRDGKYGDAGEPKRDEDGNPRLKSERLSDRDVYRNNVADMEQGDQVHHIIPDNLARRHPLMAAARDAGYDLDHASNLIGMAGSKTPETESGKDIGHRTSHPDYDAEVFGSLNTAQKRLEKEYGDMKSAPKSRLLNEVRKVESEFRKRIEDMDVPVKDGRLAVVESEGRDAA